MVQEDTPDSKGTTHGTITVVYQKANAQGESVTPPLCLKDASNLKVTPYNTTIMQCNKPKHIPVDTEKSNFTVNSTGVDKKYQQQLFSWVIAYKTCRLQGDKIPGWAGYNSLLSENQLMTQIGALPLLPEVAHEWSTLLTVMMQTRKLNELATGVVHDPTVISCDMALYEKVVQILDSRPDLKSQFVPRLGELHVVMAALRALGSSIENSGIDEAWLEADVYGPATTRQILKCTHYKRSLCAHIYTYTALYEMALEVFYKDNPSLKQSCTKAANNVQEACHNAEHTTSVKQANTNILHFLADNKVFEKFQDWEKQKSKNAMFKSMMNYLHRVETILHFVAATRNADIHLHLEAGENLSRMFFAMDRLKHKRLWPRYISDMQSLKLKHPNTWMELEAGNISITKTEDIPFVSLGADHALEQVNKTIKDPSSLIGISNNANARQRFFLATPELGCLATEYKNQFAQRTKVAREHHNLMPNVINREHTIIDKIKEAITRHTHPFTVEGDSLYNIINHAYVPQEYVQQILNIDEIGQKLYENYVEDRITGNTSIWAPVKRENNKMYTSGNTKKTLKIRDKSIDLKETKDLYGRLMILCKSSRDVDMRQVIGDYEFTLTPRSLFAPSGSLLLCTDKSKIIHALLELVPENPSDNDPQAIHLSPVGVEATPEHCHRVAIIDGMVFVQKLAKSVMHTVADLSKGFINKLIQEIMMRLWWYFTHTKMNP